MTGALWSLISPTGKEEFTRYFDTYDEAMNDALDSQNLEHLHIDRVIDSRASPSPFPSKPSNVIPITRGKESLS